MKISNGAVRTFKSLGSFVASVLIFSLVVLPTAPVFALGEIEVTPPPTPPAPVVDLCPNIDGAQASIPGGMILDGSGNCVTPPPADTTAPVISAVVDVSVSTVAQTITWVTNELSVSTFEYGTSQAYGTPATISASLLIGGTAVLTGLTPNTTYYYCIHATDASQNTSNSCGHSFTTATPVDATAPDITVVSVTPITQTSATVTWTTNEVANSQVEYGTSASYGTSSTLDTSLALTHSVALSGLTANTTYHYRIKTTDGAQNQTIGPDETFTTSAVSGNVQVRDTTPPVVSEVGTVSVGTTNATLGWTTNELAVSTLEYGTSQSYGTHPTISGTALLAHTAILTGLTPNTTYYYCIHATDIATNVTNSCPHSFTTDSASAPADTTAPIISLTTATPVGSSGATVTWTTNELANGQVQYGLTSSYTATSTLDAIEALTHSTDLSGLTPSTTYHYRVRSTDDSGNLALGSDQTFTTGAASQVQSAAAVISGIETVSITSSNVTVMWNTNLPSDSQIEYGVNSNLGSLTTLDTNLSTSHAVTISGLTPNTNYIFRVKSKAAGAVTTTSTNYEFDTLAVSTPQSTPAVVSNVVASPSSTSATVIWSTDKTATSFLQYGITTTYGLDGTHVSSLSTSHTQSLSNLQPSTIYHYRVISVDADLNTTTSDDHTFTTSAPISGVVNPPSASNISVSEHGDTYSTLSWSVSSALIDTAAEYDIHYSTSPITEQNFESTHAAQEVIIGYEDLQPNGTSRTYTVVGLNSSTLYYFAIKSKYQASTWSAISNTPTITTRAVTVSTVSSNSTSGSTGGGGVSGSAGGGVVSVNVFVVGPTSVTAEGNDHQVTLNWKNPTNSNYVRTIIIEKVGSYPTSPTDGEKVYEGRGETFTDIEDPGSAPKTDYFAVYTFDKEGNYSTPAKVSLASQVGSTQFVSIGKSIAKRVTQYSFLDAITYGDTGNEVTHLQQILATQPQIYPRKLVTGYFGSYTKDAISKFQTQQKLPVTGVADHVTTSALNALSPLDATVVHVQFTSTFDQNLQYGQTAEDVQALQHFLVGDGDYTGAVISEYFGSITRNAVIRFQQKYGITPAQGYVGPKTRAQIKTLLGL